MYLLFVGHNYYPSGGINDFIATFAHQKDAEKALETQQANWAHIAYIDFHLNTVITVATYQSRHTDDGIIWKQT